MPIISGGGSGGLPGVTVSGAAAASKVLVATSSSAASWAFPPGFEIGFDQTTTSVPITATTEGTATTYIACAAHTFDGGLVLVTFCPGLAYNTPGTNGGSIRAGLFESGTLINIFGFLQSQNTNNAGNNMIGMLRFTPSAGSHTYTVGAWASVNTGTPEIYCGAGGPGNGPPGWVRFTKV